MQSSPHIFTPRSTALTPQSLRASAATQDISSLNPPKFPALSEETFRALWTVEQAPAGEKSRELEGAIKLLHQSKDRQVGHHLVELMLTGPDHVATRTNDLIVHSGGSRELLAGARRCYQARSVIEKEDQAETLTLLGSAKANPAIASALYFMACNGSREAALALRGFDDELILQNVVEQLDRAHSIDQFLFCREIRRMESMPLMLHGFDDLRALEVLGRCAQHPVFALNALRALGGARDAESHSVLVAALGVEHGDCEERWKNRNAAAEALRECLPNERLQGALVKLSTLDPLGSAPRPLRALMNLAIAVSESSYHENRAQTHAACAIALQDVAPEVSRTVLTGLTLESALATYCVNQTLDTLNERARRA